MPRPTLSTLLIAALSLLWELLYLLIKGVMAATFITAILFGLYLIYPPLAFIIGGIIGLVIIAD
jgi:hypothetical protein